MLILDLSWGLKENLSRRLIFVLHNPGETSGIQFGWVLRKVTSIRIAPSLISLRVHIWKAEGGCPGWSQTSLGAKVILLVLSWGGSFYFVSLASKILISVILRSFISWNSLRKWGFLCIHARICLSPFIMSHCRRVVILTFIFHDGRRVSLFIQPSSRPKERLRAFRAEYGIRLYRLLIIAFLSTLVSLMVNGNVDIYKDNRRKHLRTHTMSNSNRRCIITTGLKLFCIFMLLTEPALSTVVVKPKITAFKTPSNNGKCYYWYYILCWLTWQLYLAIHSVSNTYM